VLYNISVYGKETFCDNAVRLFRGFFDDTEPSFQTVKFNDTCRTKNSNTAQSDVITFAFQLPQRHLVCFKSFGTLCQISIMIRSFDGNGRDIAIGIESHCFFYGARLLG
jgi:hypothetical protein